MAATPLVWVLPPDRRSIRRTISRLAGQEFVWAYLGLNIAEFHGAQDLLRGRGTYLDVMPQFHRAAEDLREPYLAHIYGIGRELNSLRWWTTSLSYRNGAISKTYHQVCYLKLALDLVRSWHSRQTLVILASCGVRKALRRNLLTAERGLVRVSVAQEPRPGGVLRDTASMLAHRGFFFLRESYRMVQSRRVMRPLFKPAEETTIIISWATTANLQGSGEFHQSFFGDLAFRLGDLGIRTAVAPIVLRDVKYLSALHRFRQLSLPVMVPHRYLRWSDLLRSMVSSCSKPPGPKSVQPFCGMDIGSLLAEDMNRYWVTNAAADAQMMTALVRRWAEMGLAINRFIYVYENQPLERALVWEVRRSFPGASLVGYQHAGVPRFVLNLYLAPGEGREAPLPDWIVTVGRHTARLLSRDGYEPGFIRTGGALQMQGLLALSARSNGSAIRQPEPTVLVATSSSLEETAELAYIAAHLFDADEGVRVVLKCHPTAPFHRISGLIGRQMPDHVEVSDDPIVELMLRSTVMVYSGSAVCVQALALGLPVVHLRPQFDFDSDQLEGAEDLRLEATGLEELRQHVRWLLKHREAYISQHREKWNRLVADMYCPVTESTYRAFLR